MDFYQVIEGRKYLDFNKIRKMGYPINFILSERALQGKTMNCLDHILNRYREKGERAVWVFNTEKQITNAKQSMLMNSKIHYPEKWKTVVASRRGLYDKGKFFCYFIALQQAYQYKIGRDYSVKTIVYDEFNAGTTQIGADQHIYWETLVNTFAPLNTSNNDLVCFLLANVKTLGNVLLSKYDINSFDDELTVRSFNGMKLTLLYVPKNQQELIGTTKNWAMVNSEQLKLERESFFAENVKDNMTNIIHLDDRYKYKMNKKMRIQIMENMLLCWESENGLFFEQVDKDTHTEIPICTSQLEDVDTNHIYLPELKKKLILKFEAGELFFASFYAKLLLKKVIWKH